MLDVGCGSGAWLATFQRLGVDDVYGIDGDYASKALVISAENFRGVDLRRGFDLGRSFDLVVSLEVAEHLPPPAASRFVASLVRHSDLILFSAAVPEQYGPGHVNCRWPAYWYDLFRSHGYECADILRDRYWTRSDIAWWYRQNIMFFGTPGRLKSLGGATGSPAARRHPEIVTRRPRRWRKTMRRWGSRLSRPAGR